MTQPARGAVLQPDATGIAAAVEALIGGHLVVFPTETVYGLGANALDAHAVASVYQAKGRPSDNPLIVHCASEGGARELASEWNATAQSLARTFWPGPLTIVVPRRPGPTDAVAGKLDTIALRVPSHPVAQALLRAASVPVAAPSANTSGRPSPTRVKDARADLGNHVAVYLDGGDTDVGLESTVVQVEDGRVTLLRKGGVAQEALEAVVGPMAHAAPDGSGPVRSPGMKYRHYAPKARIVLATGPEARRLLAAPPTPKTGFLLARETAEGLDAGDARLVVAGTRKDGAAWAHSLFAALRDLDEACDTIVVEAIPEDGVGAAVMDRLRRAAQRL